MAKTVLKTKIFILILLVAVVSGSCTPTTRDVLKETATAAPTFTFVPPTLTPTWRVTPKITATPLNLGLNTDVEIMNVIKQLHSGICPAYNLAKETPPSAVPPPPALQFIEVDKLPDPNLYDVEEIAENIDKSRRAVIACKPEKCVDDVYVKENTTGRVYKIDWGAMSWRPIQWLAWIDKDTLLFAQSSNPHYGVFVAIDFAKKEYLYYGMATDEYDCSSSTSTPTPW